MLLLAACGHVLYPCKLSVAHDPRNLTVLQVLPSLVTGGVERGTLEITQAIVAGGRHSSGCQRRRPPGDARSSAPAVVTSRCRSTSKNPLVIWRNAGVLATIIRAEHVAIVHARSRAPAWSAWLACRRTGAHFVTT